MIFLLLTLVNPQAINKKVDFSYSIKKILKFINIYAIFVRKCDIIYTILLKE